MTFPWTHEILGLFYNTVNLLVKIAEIDFEKKFKRPATRRNSPTDDRPYPDLLYQYAQ